MPSCHSFLKLDRTPIEKNVRMKKITLNVLASPIAAGTFEAISAGGHRQARRRLRHQPVWLRDLGRPHNFLAVLQRHQAAAGRLIVARSIPMPQTDIRTELERAAPEPLLPVEKKLIGFS